MYHRRLYSSCFHLTVGYEGNGCEEFDDGCCDWCCCGDGYDGGRYG